MNKFSIIALLLASTSAIRISGPEDELGGLLGGAPAASKPKTDAPAKAPAAPAKAPKPTAPARKSGYDGRSSGDSQSLAKTQSLAAGKPLPASGIPAELGIGAAPAAPKPAPAAPKPVAAKPSSKYDGRSSGDSQSLAKVQSLASGKPLPASGIPAELGIGAAPAAPKPTPAAPKPVAAKPASKYDGRSSGDSQSLITQH